MKTLLQLNTSLYGASGQSSQLASRFVDAWKAQNPEGQVVRRDLSADEVPHLTAERFRAFTAKPAERTTEQQAVVDYSDALVDELRGADVLVLGVPLYNFAIPSTLKAYIDHVARAGVTFRYTEKGPVGLLTGKKAYVFAARGGSYAGTPDDTQTAYLRYMLAFLGITDVEFVYAEGLAMDATTRERALANARARADTLIGPQLALAA